MRFRLQTFSSFKGAAPFKLRLSRSKWRLALTSFAAKVGLFWLSELVTCQWVKNTDFAMLWEKVLFLPYHIRDNRTTDDPTDQVLKKPLKFKILA